MNIQQKIINRLGTIYISLIAFIVILEILLNGLSIFDIINLLLVLLLFILLQTKLINLNIQCILSTIIGIVIFVTGEAITILMALWLAIYSTISFFKLKKDH